MNALPGKNNNKQWRCRWATRQDQDALLKLFESAFGHAMPDSLWQWKYAWQEKPGILAYLGNTVVAYYGGIPRTFSSNETIIKAAQICDVMVAPEMRGILTRKGPFMHTADTYLSEQAGSDKPYRFAFGFPSQRHARLGEKSGWYTRSDTFLEASWTSNKFWPHLPFLPFGINTRPLTIQDEAIINTLWQTMQASLPNYLIPLKDADFFKWRYLNHPCYNYASYIVSKRPGGKIMGIFTLRNHDDGHGMELMDVLGPPDALVMLLKVALDIAKRSGQKRLFSWMTPAILAHLPEPLTTKEISGVYVTPDYKQIIDQQLLSWWLMSGDTEFR